MRTSVQWLVLFSLACLLTGCEDFTGVRGTKPLPLPEPKPPDAPFIYGAGERVLVFAAVGGNVLDVNRNSGPIVDFLGRALGVRFKLEYYRRYPDIIDSMVKKKADFAWLGPTTYLAVRRQIPCVPVAQILRDGVNYYEGIILVRALDGIRNVQDLEGKRFAFVDRNSTSGFLYPASYLKKHGIDYETFFSQVDFAGGHSNAMLRLISGQYDAVTTERDILKRLAEKVDVTKVRVLAVTGRIPNGPIAARADLGTDFLERAAAALTGMSADPEGAKLLAELRELSNFSGFGPVTAEAYDEVESVLDEVRR